MYTEIDLTIKDLADRVNVTPSYISKIERDLIDPSLSVLRKILLALGFSLALLFSKESQSGGVEISKEKRTRVNL